MSLQLPASTANRTLCKCVDRRGLFGDTTANKVIVSGCCETNQTNMFGILMLHKFTNKIARKMNKLAYSSSACMSNDVSADWLIKRKEIRNENERIMNNE